LFLSINWNIIFSEEKSGKHEETVLDEKIYERFLGKIFTKYNEHYLDNTIKRWNRWTASKKKNIAVSKEVPFSFVIEVSQISEKAQVIKAKLGAKTSLLENNSLLLKLAILYHIQGDLYKAKQAYLDYFSASKEHPEWQKAIIQYAFLLIQMKSNQEAFYELNKLIGKYETSFYVDIGKIILSDIYYRKKEYIKGLKLLQEINPSNKSNNLFFYSALRASAMFLEKKLYLDALKKVRFLLRKQDTLRSNPQDNKLLHATEMISSVILYKSGHSRLLHQIIDDKDFYPANAQIVYFLARINCGRERISKCISAYESLLRRFPYEEDTPSYHLELLGHLKKLSDPFGYVNHKQKVAYYYQPGSVWSSKQKNTKVKEKAHKIAWVAGYEVANYHYKMALKTKRADKYLLASNFYSGLLNNYSSVPKEYKKKKEGVAYALINSLFLGHSYQKAKMETKRWIKEFSNKELQKKVAFILVQATYNLFKNMEEDLKRQKTKAGKLPKKAEELISAVDNYQKMFPKDIDGYKINLIAAEVLEQCGSTSRARIYLSKNFNENVPVPVLQSSVRRFLVSHIQEKKPDQVFSWSGKLLQNTAVQKSGMTKELLNIHGSALKELAIIFEQEKKIEKLIQMYIQFSENFVKHKFAKSFLSNAVRLAMQYSFYSKTIYAAKLYNRNYPPSLKNLSILAKAYEELCLFKRASDIYSTLYNQFPKEPEGKVALEKLIELQEGLGLYLQAAYNLEKYLSFISASSKKGTSLLIRTGNLFYQGKSYLKAVVYYAKAAKFELTDRQKAIVRLGKYKSYLGMKKIKRAKLALNQLLSGLQSLTQEALSQDQILQKILVEGYYQKIKNFRQDFIKRRVLRRKHRGIRQLTAKEKDLTQIISGEMLGKALLYAKENNKISIEEELRLLYQNLNNDYLSILEVKGLVSKENFPLMQERLDKLSKKLMVYQKSLTISKTIRGKLFREKDLLYQN